MRPWFWVIIGGVFETGWAVTMKLSEGFSNIPYSVVTIALMLVSTFLLNIGLKAGIPMGPGYAVWVGIGAIGATIAGIVIFDEVLNLLGFIFLSVVICGIIGLNLVSNKEDNQGS